MTSPSRASRRPGLAPVALLVAALLGLVACSSGSGSGSGPGSGSPSGDASGTSGGSPSPTALPVRSPEQAAQDFLDRYVQDDGQVVRIDQDGTTVSEGQAYAFVVAQALGQDDVAARTFRWAEENLLRPDGTFSFLASADGTVIDETAASDADLLLAWGLLRSGDDQLVARGQQLAEAILRTQVVQVIGETVLLAGAWARQDEGDDTSTVNPSYWAFAPMAAMAELVDDRRWQSMRASAEALTGRVTQDGSLLPPNWASVEPRAGIQPRTTPGEPDVGPQYGLDAQRTVVWAATACDPQLQALAARWWQLLQDPQVSGALAVSLDGQQVLDPASNPLPLVASAAAADAAGDAEARDRLLDAADRQDQRFPTYYGAAWLALGRLLLQTDTVDVCAPGTV